MADAHAGADHMRTVFVWAVVCAALLILWRSRALLRIRDRLAARSVPEGWLSLAGPFLFAFWAEIALTLAQWLAAAIWPSGAAASPSLPEAISSIVLTTLLSGLGLWLLFAGLRRARWAWIGFSGLAAATILVVVALAPVTLIPEMRGDRPSVPGASTMSILSFVNKNGLNADRLYVFDGADPLDVDMEGLGPLTHAAVSRAALAAPRAETYAAIGHLLGHYRHKDLWSLALLWSAFGAVFFWSVSAARRVLVRKSGGERPASVDNAQGAPILGLIAWGMIMAATPVFNSFDQAINIRADDYALEATRDPDALCRWLVATEAGEKVDPSPLETLVFYDHPPLKARLVNAMGWKAAHGGDESAAL